MSESKALPRPRQVTVAGGAAIVGCALLVAALFDAMPQVRSPETRSTFAEFLSRPPGNGLGIDVQQAMSIAHGVVLLNGALAAAATVLAVFTLRRHNGARIGLSVAAALLVFTSPLIGVGPLPFLVAVAATMLWSAPARDWFAGRPPRPVPERGARERSARTTDDLRAWAPPVAEQRLDPPPHDSGQPSGPPADPGPPTGPTPVQPRPADHPFGSAPVPPQQYGVPVSPWGGGPTGLPPAPGRRPVQVTVAAWITWVFSGFTAVTYLILLIGLVGLKDEVLRQLHKNPEIQRLDISDRDLIATMWVLGVVVLFWALSALVLAFLAYRRVGWARIALAVSAGITGLVALIGAQLAGLPHAFAAFTVLALLFHSASNAWFAGRPGRDAEPPSGPSYGGPPSAEPEPQPEPPAEPKPPKNVW